ncbi:MAG: ABC transporter permease subunit [Dehalogenimonas sp.]|uniref:ABC transporter permease subunit n=1 Tax=Candidatus Dehalogenimonas loeffleri TaxID=3127115 RepID=A0ABZ2J9R6_9CHLR|nr:ABC transporter permease subunit [Dehalogenimonas sp.]
MNIFKYEVFKRLGTTLIWIVSLGLFIYATFAFFESFQGSSFTDLLDGFPDAFKKAFGLEQDLSTILGYFSFLAIYLFLAGAIFSSNLGLNAVSVEERDLTADFLISKPVTRNRIVTAKLLAGLVHVLLFNVSMGLVCYAGIESFSGGQEYSMQAFVLIIAGVFIFQLLFYAVGFILSVLMKRMDSPLPFSLGLSIGLYVLYSFDAVLEDTPIKYLVPYDYFNPGYIITNEAFQTTGLVISIGVILLSVTAGYILYNRRDIATAM